MKMHYIITLEHYTTGGQKVRYTSDGIYNVVPGMSRQGVFHEIKDYTLKAHDATEEGVTLFFDLSEEYT